MQPNPAEAAERLRRDMYHSGSLGGETERQCDLWTVARAYLAETDETPLDEAFLRSVGGIQEDNQIKWTFYRENGLPIGLWHVDDGWKAMLIHAPHAATCIVRGLKTRGDFRRLMNPLTAAQRQEHP